MLCSPENISTQLHVATILQYRQSTKRVFNVSAMLIHDTQQTMFPFTYAMVSDSADSARHSSTIAYIN